MKYFNLFYYFIMVCVLQWTSMINAKAVNNEANEIKLKFPQKKNYDNENYVNFNKHGELYMVSAGPDKFGQRHEGAFQFDYCHYNYSRGFIKCTFKGIRQNSKTFVNIFPKLKVKLYISGKKNKNCKINKNTKITKVDTNLSENRAGYYDYIDDNFNNVEIYIKKLTLNANNGCTITLNVNDFDIALEK